jgi:predicted transcriptional regulator
MIRLVGVPQKGARAGIIIRCLGSAAALSVPVRSESLPHGSGSTVSASTLRDGFSERRYGRVREPHRKVTLGTLELAVLDRLWEGGPADVAAMHAAVGEPRGLVRNTIQSTLERLARKGLAERRKVGRAYEYRARISRSAWLSRMLGSVIDEVPGVDPPLLLSAFVDLVERADAATLEELEMLVRARREERGEEP